MAVLFADLWIQKGKDKAYEKKIRTYAISGTNAKVDKLENLGKKLNELDKSSYFKLAKHEDPALDAAKGKISYTSSTTSLKANPVELSWDESGNPNTRSVDSEFAVLHDMLAEIGVNEDTQVRGTVKLHSYPLDFCPSCAEVVKDV